MKLQDITGPDLIVENLQAERRNDALRELMAVVAARHGGTTSRVEAYLWEVQRRHNLMPSGLGRGLAFPNARIADLPSPVLAIGVSRRGIDFQAADRCAAHVILLYLGRANPPDDERQMLAELSSALRTDGVIDALLQATTAEEVWQSILRIDSGHWAPQSEGKEESRRGVHGAADRVHPR